jgi:hypothetical protein
VTVLVCRKCKGHQRIVEYLEEHAAGPIKTVRCQKVCESPVAGLRVDGRWEWFASLRSPKTIKALTHLAGDPSSVPKQLEKCRSRGRSGCGPR